MEPLPETSHALESLGEYDDHRLRDQLSETADRLQELAPGVAGFSLALVAQGVTLTYVASNGETALLDAVQHLDGGPCVEAAASGETVLVDHTELFDEGRWQSFAQAGAAHGILSTLSLPILEGDSVIGGVNLYGGRPDTFDGRTLQMAELFGAWAPGAIANADLGFSTRLEAAKAPARLHDMHLVDLAVGILVAARGVGPGQARSDLERAAAQAGIDVLTLARAVLREHLGDAVDDGRATGSTE